MFEGVNASNGIGIGTAQVAVDPDLHTLLKTLLQRRLVTQRL